MLRFKTELRGYIFLNDPIKPDTQIVAFESFEKSISQTGSFMRVEG